MIMDEIGPGELHGAHLLNDEEAAAAGLERVADEADAAPSQTDLDEMDLSPLDEEGIATTEAEHDESPSNGKNDAVESMENFGNNLKGLYGTNYFVLETTKAARRTAKTASAPKAVGQVAFWTPLVFPEIPAKGDFDVSNLRKSQYFFS